MSGRNAFMDDLARRIAVACSESLQSGAISIADRSRSMYEDDGTGVATTWLCGVFHEYCIRKTERHRLFGLSWLEYDRNVTLVRFGAEEFFDVSGYFNPWYIVCDPALSAVVPPLLTPLADRPESSIARAAATRT